MFAALGAKHLDHHTVQVEALHQHPGEGTQKKEVKQDSHDLTGQLWQETKPGFHNQNMFILGFS